MEIKAHQALLRWELCGQNKYYPPPLLSLPPLDFFVSDTSANTDTNTYKYKYR